MAKKITFKKVNVPAMTLETWKEKVPMHVSRVEKATVMKDGNTSHTFRVTFKKLESPAFIEVTEDDVKFVHFCESSANGSQCAHLALGAALGNLLGASITKMGFPSEPVTSDIDDSKFVDVSEDAGVLPPVAAAAPAPAVSAASTPTPTPAAVSKPSEKRDWSVGWNDVQDYLQEQGLDTRQILMVKEKRIEICDTVQMTTMAVEPIKPNFPYVGEMLGRAIRHVLNSKDLILAGDKGSGKDTLVSTLAWVFGLPLYLQTGNSDETKESVVGENTIVQGPKGMEVEFRKTAFATAVEMGGLSHYAELNMIDGDVTSIFHSLLDENRQLATQVGSIPRHKGHLFIGSINVGEQYKGVKKLNGAFKDRCAILNLPYVTDFRGMLVGKTGLTDAHALDFLENVKKAIDDLISTEQQGEESKTVRGYIDASKHLKSYGVSFDTKVEVLEDFIINKTEDFEEKMAIRDMIRQKVWTDFPMSVEEEQYVNGGV